ncbi:MAG: hypothetical protein KF895_07105 [Parvibaculum sp.]|nr:hypothetical protein [Parvibaculum sp.]
MTDYRNPYVQDDDRRTSRIIYGVAAALVAVAVVTVLYFATAAPKPDGLYPIPTEVVGRLDQDHRDVARRLGAEPCNRTLATRLANKLLNNSEYSAALSFIRNTEAACGPNEDLLPIVFFRKRVRPISPERRKPRISCWKSTLARRAYTRGALKRGMGAAISTGRMKTSAGRSISFPIPIA